MSINLEREKIHHTLNKFIKYQKKYYQLGILSYYYYFGCKRGAQGKRTKQTYLTFLEKHTISVPLFTQNLGMRVPLFDIQVRFPLSNPCE
jgi:hypothetical protein